MKQWINRAWPKKTISVLIIYQIGIVALILYSALNISTKNYYGLIVNLTYLILLSVSSVIIILRGLIAASYRIAVIGLVLTLASFLVPSQAIYHQEIQIWLFLFPIVCFFVFGRKEGVVWSSVGLLLLLHILFSTYSNEKIVVFSVRAVVLYSFVMLVMYFYENVKEQREKILRKSLEKLECSNRELEVEIVERKKVEKKISKLSQALSQSPVAIIISDLEFNIEYVNPFFTKMSGYSSVDIVGKKTDSLSLREYSQNERMKMLKTLNAGNELRRESLCKTKTGKEYWISTIVSTIRDIEERITHYLEVQEDITERKQVEDEKQKLESQLKQVQKLDDIGQLAGGIAHDFNNVLNGIMSAAQLLQMPKRNLDEEGITYVNMIFRASIRATDLIGKLLAFGRQAEIELIPVDLHKLIDDTVSILKRTIDKKIVITFIKKAKNSYCIGDHSALEHIFINLGINASHAMENGGTLHLRTENVHINQSYCDSSLFDIRTGEYCKISITDTGIGIPSENMPKLFEPFFTTKELGKGTGLGLAAVYGNMKEHHGEIIVESTVGIGTSFTILLPCSEEPALKKQKKKQFITQKKLNHKTIMLVDDEEINRILGQKILETLGYTVLLAENGQKAVDIFKNKHEEIDLVLMDMIMPQMNGSEAFLIMKKIDSSCKVILSSGNTKTKTINELKVLGLAGSIHKPYIISELNNILDGILDQQE